MTTLRLVFDFDSTMTTCEMLEELAAIALAGNPDAKEVNAQINKIMEQGMSGQLGFDESLRRRLDMIAVTQQHWQELLVLLMQRISPSFVRNREWLAANADNIYIVSGGFRDAIVPVAQYLGLRPDHVYANTLTWNHDGTKVVGFDADLPTAKAGGKVIQLRQLQLAHPVVMIGDGYTDYETKASGAADVFWAYTETVSRESVTALADLVVTNLDEVIKAAEGAVLSAALQTNRAD